MRWLVGHLFDGWNNLRALVGIWHESIDRAMNWEDSHE